MWIRSAAVIVALGMQMGAPAVAAEVKATVTSKEAHVLCASANALVAVKMPAGVAKDILNREARRHADEARARGATQDEITASLRQMGDAYNEDELPWKQMVEFAELCTQI